VQRRKNLSLFYKKKDTKDGFTSRCKTCIDNYYKVNIDTIKIKKKEQHKTYYKIHKDSIIAYQKEYRELNKERVASTKQKYAETNALKIAKYIKEYGKINSVKLKAIRAKRRAAKLKAAPRWLTTEDRRQIQEFYEIAQAFRLYTGQEYHVDHIVPLQGKNVCGLHVPWNLQVIPAKENLRKSNKFSEN